MPEPILLHRHPFQIVESHLDTFGHVNNATYLKLFEEARWALITERGYGLDTIQSTRRGPVILEANVKFRRELKNRESVMIETSLVDYSSKLGKLRQQLLKADGTLSADAHFVIALWDIDARRLIEPTPEWARAMSEPLQ